MFYNYRGLKRRGESLSFLCYNIVKGGCGAIAKLTNKQEKFVQELIKGLSQRGAYKKAYNTSKMKDKTIDEKASRLFKNDKVRARFDEINDKVVKKAEEKTIASVIEVLEFYSNVMKGKEKDVNINGFGVAKEVPAALKERLKAADALAKKYGIDKLVEDKDDDKVVIKDDID